MAILTGLLWRIIHIPQTGITNRRVIRFQQTYVFLFLFLEPTCASRDGNKCAKDIYFRFSMLVPNFGVGHGTNVVPTLTHLISTIYFIFFVTVSFWPQNATLYTYICISTSPTPALLQSPASSSSAERRKKREPWRTSRRRRPCHLPTGPGSRPEGQCPRCRLRTSLRRRAARWLWMQSYIGRSSRPRASWARSSSCLSDRGGLGK